MKILKLLSFLACALVMPAATHCLSQQVTKPYRPSLLGTYPSIVNILQVGGLSSTAYVLARHQNKINPAYIAVAAGALGCAYNFYKKINLLDALLTNPSRALHDANDVNDRFATQGRKSGLEAEGLDVNTVINGYKALEQRFAKQSSVFLLGECIQDGWGACSLSRCYQPEYRQVFEERAVHDLLESAQHNQAVHYVSFGCGGMLQDLVILAKALAQKPNANIVIHLIDGQHGVYVGARDLLGNTREVKPEYTVDPQSVMKQFKHEAKTEGGLNDMTDQELERQLIMTPVLLEVKYKQFINYLKNTFPNAQLSLYIHDTAKSYLDYIKKHRLPYPDLITAADIEDEMSQIKRGPLSYVQLCAEVLQHKPSSSNLWLGKRGYDKAELRTIKLHEFAGSKEEEVELHGRKLSIHVRSEEIQTSNRFLNLLRSAL